MVDYAVWLRYLSKFSIGDPDECWPWQVRSRDKDGYGLFWDGTKSPLRYNHMVRVHRWAFEQLFGPIPPGLHVCHTCDNPPCQNPWHWFLGTPRANMDDKHAKGRGRYTSGDVHQNAKLTREQVEEIRRRYLGQPGASSRQNQGLTQRQLALEYGVSREAISKIIRGIRHTTHGYIPEATGSRGPS